jgi:response regulator RpfG family c-di-GMP phosphodiesterase
MIPRILCVDDDVHVLESLRDSLRRRFEVVSSTNGFEALKMMVAAPFPVVVSDMRMPLIDGARFLKLAREHAPDTVRILLTGQSTLDDAIATVNDGQIFRFLLKPCPTHDLIAAIDAGIALHEELKARQPGEMDKASGVVRSMTAMAAAVDPTAAGRGARIRRSAIDLSKALKVSYGEEIARACELSQLGAIALPRDTLAQLASDRALNAEQGAQLERLPESAASFLEGIPSRSSERALIAHLARPLVPTKPGAVGTPLSARIARVVLDYDVLRMQRVPDDVRLAKMRERTGRYDAAVVDKFEDVLED